MLSEEKLGGRPVTEVETRHFNNCMGVCNLDDAGFQGRFPKHR